MKKNILLTSTLLIYLLLNLNSCNLKDAENLNKNKQDNIDQKFIPKDDSEVGFQSDEGNESESELERNKKEEDEQKLYKWFKDTMDWYSWHISAIYNHFTGFIGNVSTYGNPTENNYETYFKIIKEAYESGEPYKGDHQKEWGGIKKNKENIKKYLEEMIKECERIKIQTQQLKEKSQKLEDKIKEFEESVQGYEKDNKNNNKNNEIKASLKVAKELVELYNELEELTVKSYLEIFKKVVLTDTIFKTGKFQNQLKEEFGSKINNTETCLNSSSSPINCYGENMGKDLLP